MDMGIRNFMDNEVKAKIIDNLKAHSNDWDCFLEYLNQNFDLNETSSWNEFVREMDNVRQFYSFIITIVSDYKLISEQNNRILNEIILIAKFYNNQIDISECSSKIESNFAKMLFLITWITKLQNENNKDKFIYNFQIFLDRNYFSLYDCSNLIEHKDELIEFFKKIEMEGVKPLLDIFNSNLNQEEFNDTKSFVDMISDSLVNVNSFSYQHVAIKPTCWEERFLSEMLDGVITKSGEYSISFLADYFCSDSNLNFFSEQRINHMINFFDDQRANFILETVNYLLNGVDVSNLVIDNHCKLLVNALTSNDNLLSIFSTSSFNFILKLLKNKRINKDKSESVIDFRKKMAGIRDAQILYFLETDGYPISKDQKDIVKEWARSLYKTVDEINNVHTFDSYLKKGMLLCQ